MQQFLKKIFILAILLTGFIALTFWQIDGSDDQFYLRFITSKKHSLILGTSRGAQGIKPNVIDSILGREGMFNYAMTLGHSPYGKVYYESVIKKLEPSTRNGLFILEVSPWSIGSESEDEADFAEQDRFLGKLNCVSCNPNIGYLREFYPDLFIHLLDNTDSTKFLHTDGWLEVTIPMDSEVVAERVQDKMNNYGNNMFPKYPFSATRYSYLKKTVEFLQKHGRVFLVRLPVYSGMYEIEDKLMPDFDDKMEALCDNDGAVYLNYGADGSKYQFTDGNHLWKGSAQEFSEVLGERIRRDWR